MAKIYQFRDKRKTIKEMIHEGHITEKIRTHLHEAYHRHETLYPNDWDTKFIKKMLTWKENLSSQQKEQLLKILKYEIQEEEYPNGILDMGYCLRSINKK